MPRPWRSSSSSSSALAMNDSTFHVAVPGDKPSATLKLVVSYDGADFVGSQVQTGQRTVQDELDRALTTLGGMPVTTVFAGRTDRGVHASGQVVSTVDIRPCDSTGQVMQALNGLLPDDIAVVEASREHGGFHARFDALWREYRYRIWAGPRQPLVRRQVWFRRSRLDEARMDAAARVFVGQRDMAALASFGRGVPWTEGRPEGRGTVRHVLRCACQRIAPWWEVERSVGDLFEVQVAADGFLPRMVRAMVALIVEVGMGTRPVSWIGDVLASQDRRQASGSAPAHGLTLSRVGYG